MLKMDLCSFMLEPLPLKQSKLVFLMYTKNDFFFKNISAECYDLRFIIYYIYRIDFVFTSDNTILMLLANHII